MLIVDMSKVFEAAQTYVMLSRVQELEQLIIIESVKREKIYPSTSAINELEKMNKKAINSNKDLKLYDLKMVSLNIRSLKKHMIDLIKEPAIVRAEVILVQQTCLKSSESVEEYQMEMYNSHFNSAGEGKGIAFYFTGNYKHVSDISVEKYQISKIRSKKYDIICVYRSSDTCKSNQISFLNDLHRLLDIKRKTFILGDFNFDALSHDRNLILIELENWNFKQLIENATHIKGGLIDHCYISDNINPVSLTVYQKSVYYTDHDIIPVIVT